MRNAKGSGRGPFHSPPTPFVRCARRAGAKDASASRCLLRAPLPTDRPPTVALLFSICNLNEATFSRRARRRYPVPSTVCVCVCICTHHHARVRIYATRIFYDEQWAWGAGAVLYTHAYVHCTIICIYECGAQCRCETTGMRVRCWRRIRERKKKTVRIRWNIRGAKRKVIPRRRLPGENEIPTTHANCHTGRSPRNIPISFLYPVMVFFHHLQSPIIAPFWGQKHRSRLIIYLVKYIIYVFVCLFSYRK